MKNIHFDNLHSKKNYLTVLSGVGILLILYFILKDTEQEKIFFLILNLFSLILISRMFWYKAHVQYSASRISIKINNKSHINIKFDDMTHIEYGNTELIIKENAKTHKIDVEDVNPVDVQKLVNILVERSEAFYKDSSKLNYYE